MKRIEIKSYRIRAEKIVDGYKNEDILVCKAQHNIDIIVNANNINEAIDKATGYFNDDEYEIVYLELEPVYHPTPF